jgi:hypothetical protein
VKQALAPGADGRYVGHEPVKLGLHPGIKSASRTAILQT